MVFSEEQLFSYCSLHSSLKSIITSALGLYLLQIILSSSLRCVNNLFSLNVIVKEQTGQEQKLGYFRTVVQLGIFTALSEVFSWLHFKAFSHMCLCISKVLFSCCHDSQG
jgi:hypothetical protein